MKFDTPIVLDDEFDQDYFQDRKICYFRSTEDFQSVDFKINTLNTDDIYIYVIPPCSSDTMTYIYVMAKFRKSTIELTISS